VRSEPRILSEIYRRRFLELATLGAGLERVRTVNDTLCDRARIREIARWLCAGHVALNKLEDYRNTCRRGFSDKLEVVTGQQWKDRWASNMSAR
jgi:hypothetical protein